MYKACDPFPNTFFSFHGLITSPPHHYNNPFPSLYTPRLFTPHALFSFHARCHPTPSPFRSMHALTPQPPVLNIQWGTGPLKWVSVCFDCERRGRRRRRQAGRQGGKEGGREGGRKVCVEIRNVFVCVCLCVCVCVCVLPACLLCMCNLSL